MRRKVFLSLAIVVALVVGGVAGGLLNGVTLGESGGSVHTLINYQGTLLDLSTGSPVPDGNYTIVFSLYDVDTGGSSLWQETQQVNVTDGLFSVLLGSNVSLNATLFDGSPRYLGIKVESDDEMTPRQLLASVSYAFQAENADTLDGMEGADLEESAEIDADIAAHASNANAHHARYTDSEAWAAVLSNDGPGSTLNADMLDGMNSANFATAAHTHDNRYYTESESDTRYVNVGGDTMTGTLNLPANGLVAGTNQLVLTDGKVGIGTSPGNYKLNVMGGSGRGIYGYGNVYGVRGDSTDGMAVCGFSTNDVGVYGRSTYHTGVYGYSYYNIGVYGNGATYDFYASGLGTNYGPFTGAHEVKLSADFSEDIQPGMIVSVTGEVQMRMADGETSYSSTLPTVQLSNTLNDSKVLGVLIAEAPLLEDHWYISDEGDRFGIVNALGEGRVWGTNINGDIEAGDYITTSLIAGYGQKQDDDLLHSYTLGKAIEDVDWSEVIETVEFNGYTYKAYPIAVVYTSG